MSSNQTTERNKAVVKSLWKATIAGDLETMLSHIADDARLQTIGDMPICGTRNKAQFVQAMIEMNRSLDGGGVVRLGEIVAEGDIVVAEAEGRYRTKDGRDYNGQYVYIYYLRDGKIVGLKEYSDSLHSYEIFDNDLTRGPRIARQTNIWNANAELSGTLSDAEISAAQ